jgi:hypothetical protein
MGHVTRVEIRNQSESLMSNFTHIKFICRLQTHIEPVRVCICALVCYAVNSEELRMKFSSR